MGLVALVAAVVVPLTFGTANAAGTATWTGATDGNWNVATNWQGNTLPSNGDALVFPNAAANHTMTNNLAGSWDSIDFQGSGFNITGNSVSVANGITSGGTNTITADITLTADQSFTETFTTQLVVNGTVNVNGHTLTIANPNLSSVQLLGGVSGAGSIVNNAGQAVEHNDPRRLKLLQRVRSRFPSACCRCRTAPRRARTCRSPAAASCSAPARSATSPSTARAPKRSSAARPASSPRTTRRSRTAASSSRVSTPTRARRSARAGELNAIGTVTLTGGKLQLAGGGNSQPGQVCTLIDNNGSDPVVGTFTGLPEGALVDAGGGSSDIFQLSYVGGTGNDVTLSAVGGPTFTGPGTLRLERSTVSTGEGDGTMYFKIFRIGGAVGNALYQFQTSSGTAVTGVDFIGVQGVGQSQHR